MTALIQFTILSRWKHATRGTGVAVTVKMRADGETELRVAGSLTMTDAAWNMLQTQLCPSGYSGKCAVEIIEQSEDW